jgi:predicted transcriptional regulator YdeE
MTMISITPSAVYVNSFIVSGLNDRTKNQDEFKADTAKLPKLWERFHSENLANQMPDQKFDLPIYGVYSDYDSDYTGFYTVTAGMENNNTNEKFNSVRVKEGHYLVFPNNGPLPQAIIEIWQNIWQYFVIHTEIIRSYRTDFEKYLSTEQCAVYIGIEK